MTQEELNQIIRIYAFRIPKNPSCFRPIPKSELIIDKEYKGECRNSDKATWKGNRFEYLRYKFGSCYVESIRHYEDDDGYDVFVPIKEI